MKIDKSNPRHWVLLALEGLYSVLALLVRTVTPRPRIPGVIFYGHQYCGNIMALYEQARRDGDTTIEYYCLFLDPVAASAASELGVRVLRGYRLADMLTVARAAAIVSDHGLHALFPLKRFTDITFVDVWHGIPFKGFKPADFALQHTYDEVWVSSPLLQKLYCEKLGFRQNIVHPMGYARADKLFANTLPANSFKALHNIDSGKRLVLYAPTWEHEDRSRSQMPFGETVETFFTPLVETCRQNNALLIVRSHLNTRIPDTNLADVVFCPMADFPDTESLLQETDLLICDWSSIAFDFLATQRPTVFLDVKPPFKQGYTLGPEYRFGAVVDSMQALERQVAQALSSPQDYWREYAERHRSVTEAVYGDNTDGQVAQRQIQRLKHLAENQ